MSGPLYYPMVKDQSNTTGTGTFTLNNTVPVGSLSNFSVVGNTNTCYYRAISSDSSQIEEGIGTYSTTGPTLARTTILASTNSGSAVNFTVTPITIELVAAEAFFRTASNITTPLTYATLPTAADGLRAFITDASVTASGNFGAAISSGGGSNHVPVYYDGGGSTWRIG